MSTVKSFVRQFIATVKGDDVQITAEKVFRQADSALRTQIASLKGDVIAKEDAVTEAKEARDQARINNGQKITNRDYYVEGLLSAKNNVTKAEQALKAHTEKIEFLESELVALSTEVEVKD